MELSQLIKSTDVVECGCGLQVDITDICYDSRLVTPGCAFVAIRGFAADGNRFIPDAVKSGAAVIVTDAEKPDGVPYVLVRDARAALAEMSSQFFSNPQQSVKVIGITGTKGKTTVSALVRQIIERWGMPCGLIGTNGTVIGNKTIPADRTTPESYDLFKYLAMMRDKGCKYAVMEVSSHSLCLARVHGIQFCAAVFTNLSHDHLDFHKTMEEYLAAKATLFDSCDIGVFNYDDEAGRTLIDTKSCRKLTYSAGDNAADLVAKNINLKSDRVEFEAVTLGSIERVTLGIPGMFSVYNALSAAGCALALGIPLDIIADALRTAKGAAGRVEVVPTPAKYTVIIDYAHSPDSMEKVLCAIRGFAAGRIIGLIGCGGDRDKTKRPVMAKMCVAHTDICIITSDNPRTENPRAIIDDMLPGIAGARVPIHIIEDRRAAIAFALKIAEPGDTVVLMGKGHETYQEVDGKKLHFDEREIVAGFFAGA